MEEVGIALGSNMGDRYRHLNSAVNFLKTISTDPLIEVSSFYETSPVNCSKDSEDFLNATVILKSDEVPEIFLQKLRAFEKTQGRSEIYEKNSPRPLDLDILFWGDKILKSEILTLPHPRMLQRRFVLQPLCDLRPNLILPGETKSLHYFLSNLKTEEKVARVENNY